MQAPAPVPAQRHDLTDQVSNTTTLSRQSSFSTVSSTETVLSSEEPAPVPEVEYEATQEESNNANPLKNALTGEHACELGAVGCCRRPHATS